MSPQRKFWSQFAAVVAIWLALAVVFTGQAYLVVYTSVLAHDDVAHLRPSLALTELLLSVLAECVIWAFMTLAILWLAREYPFGRGQWPRSLGVHVAACLVCCAIATLMSAVAAELIRSELPRVTLSARVFLLFFVAKFNNNIFFYAAIVAVAHVLDYYRQARERELLASQLEAKLAQTQLQVLKMQMQPHFLFNTLNAISALIHQDVELADRMIARLGDLLRTTLDNANKQEVAFQQELDFIQPYLEIEKARLGTRLTVDLEIAPETLDAKVPNLILQPLVENAIKHGIAVTPGPGTIKIQASRNNGCLHLAVTDTGPGLTASPESLKGIGLANTRERLEKLYGSKQSLNLTKSVDGGLQVSITIPYQATTAEAS
jgi:two-component system, LytTR family, sensor kinase